MDMQEQHRRGTGDSPGQQNQQHQLLDLEDLERQNPNVFANRGQQNGLNETGSSFNNNEGGEGEYKSYTESAESDDSEAASKHYILDMLAYQTASHFLIIQPEACFGEEEYNSGEVASDGKPDDNNYTAMRSSSKVHQITDTLDVSQLESYEEPTDSAPSPA